jgi:UDP-N-acetylglucosamine 1-carboxyvinyltransferase
VTDKKFEILGGKKLEGTVRNQGSKNSALAILAAALLTDEEVVLRNVPEVIDIENMVETIHATGAKVQEGPVTKIFADSISSSEVTIEGAKKIRSSLLLPAALLSRFPTIGIPLPGGDSIGTRKIDAYVLGLKALGVEFTAGSSAIKAKRTCMHIGINKIPLVFPSVTATEGLIIAASLIEGKTYVANAAREPEIVDLANFLNSMGAKIYGAGTSNLKIVGTRELHGTDYTVASDRMVAGTLIIAVAMAGGNVVVENAVPEQLLATILKLKKAGVTVVVHGGSIEVKCLKPRLKAVDVVTEVYPGFPTDMQPLFMALMTIASGTSAIQETLYDGRFGHVQELRKMGANIDLDLDTARVVGVKKLKGASVEAKNIRAGAAVTISGLVAEGVTHVSNVYEIDRGYEAFDKVLSGLGAEVKRIKT